MRRRYTDEVVKAHVAADVEVGPEIVLCPSVRSIVGGWLGCWPKASITGAGGVEPLVETWQRSTLFALSGSMSDSAIVW